jgi:hypothetical protein
MFYMKYLLSSHEVALVDITYEVGKVWAIGSGTEPEAACQTHGATRLAQPNQEEIFILDLYMYSVYGPAAKHSGTPPILPMGGFFRGRAGGWGDDAQIAADL